MTLEEPQSRPAATRARRQAILDAALTCFTEHGVAATTIEQVRERSGASIGSIYHHFGSKEELAAALYVEGLRDYQEGFVAELRSHPEAGAGVKAVVAYHLDWVAGHRDLARFMLDRRESEVRLASAAPLRELNRSFFAEVGRWLEGHVAAGAVKQLPRDLYPTLLVGLSQELARHWLAGRISSSLEEAKAVLCEATWSALKSNEGG